MAGKKSRKDKNSVTIDFFNFILYTILQPYDKKTNFAVCLALQPDKIYYVSSIAF